MGTIHAREWIATEVVRRELHYFVDNYNKNADVTNLVNTRELWFMPVANPDGYQYTFDGDRLWRKNLHDNDGDGQITNADGVDLNRNYDINWGYDDEGSSSQISSETYRGTEPASEPEVQAHQALIDRMKFKFLVTYHSYGPLLLYPFGWQIQTPSADDPLYIAYTGTDANPAITTHRSGRARVRPRRRAPTSTSRTARPTTTRTRRPEHSRGRPSSRRAATAAGSSSRTTRPRCRPSTSTTCRSRSISRDRRRIRAHPVSHLGNTVKPFYLETSSIDPEKTNNPISDFRFSVSYGDPQTVRVLAKRSLGAVELRYQINGGAVVSKPTSEWNGGERYGSDGDFYYHVVQGQVTGTTPGDSVKVWFVDADNPGVASDSFTYTAKVESVEPGARAGGRGLHRHLAGLQEDERAGVPLVLPRRAGGQRDRCGRLRRRRQRPQGAEPARRAEPLQGRHLVHGRRRDHERAGHGRGNRLATRERRDARRPRVPQRGRPPALHRQVRRLPVGIRLRVQHRDERAVQPRLRHGRLSAAVGRLPAVLPRRVHLQRRRRNDVEREDRTTSSGSTNRSPTASRWSIGTPSAGNQDHSASFIPTSTLLPPSQFPDQPDSWISSKFDRTGGPFDPHTGTHYMYSQIGDQSYKRLTRTIIGSGRRRDDVLLDVVQHRDRLGLRVRRGTHGRSGRLDDAARRERPHRHLDRRELPGGLVRHPPVPRALPDAQRRRIVLADRDDGLVERCLRLLERLAAVVGQPRCVRRQAGRGVDHVRQRLVDRRAWATSSTTSRSRRARERRRSRTTATSWTVGPATGPAPGSAPNPNNFERLAAGGFKEGPVVATPDTLYFGFGFEGISTPSARNTVMARSMAYLLR